jgi:hypothetical protein
VFISKRLMGKRQRAIRGDDKCIDMNKYKLSDLNVGTHQPHPGIEKERADVRTKCQKMATSIAKLIQNIPRDQGEMQEREIRGSNGMEM